MNGADILATRLAAAGSKQAYGIPGGEVLAVMQALDDAGIKFVLTKHENSAGFMAEGSWHADGAPGILVATIGPGVANAINVVANACQDRVPLIFITGCVDDAEAESYTHQVFDQQALLGPIVKASFKAQAGTVGLVAEKALAIALSGQPGPVHIDMPISVAEGKADEPQSVRLSPHAVPGSAHSADPATIADAAAKLSKAERPLAIAGVDAVNEGASNALASFCRAHNIPLITSYKGKGLMDESDRLSLGGAGLSPKADKLLMPLIEQSDCILLLGYDPIEMRIGWRNPWSTDKTVIEVTPVLRTHGMHWVSHTLVGALAPTLTALAEQTTPSQTWADGQADAARRELLAAFAPEPDGWGPATVFHTLREALPANAVATADSGAHRILFSQIWACNGPRQLLQSSALCTMGCAVPLAAGHVLADPGKPVLAVVGDAGLEMGLGELVTLRDQKLPVLIVTLVDESLGLIELKQRGAQRRNLGVDFDGSNFPAVAEALGGVGLWVDDKQTLAREAALAASRDTFTLLACRIGRRAYDGKF